jgi:hypothetical protein
MTKQNSEQELCGCRNTAAQCTGAGNCRVKKRIESVKPNQPDKGKEIEELRAHITRLLEAISGLDVSGGGVTKAYRVANETPAQSLQAYHDSIVEKCAAACREERLPCCTGDAEDDAYNYAIDDATSAIERLKEQK